MAEIHTFTFASGAPDGAGVGTTLRTGPGRYFEVVSATRHELKVIPVGPLRSALLELASATHAFLRAAGWYRLLDMIEDGLSRLRGWWGS